ncbi:MAG TPA: hypothetical protein VM490_18300 [Armatimonadaceae bacterium]|nr:hypothetical protein [Armatimonadaceae bacterium]
MAILEVNAEVVYRLAAQLTPEEKRELVSRLTTAKNAAAPEGARAAHRAPRVPGADRGKVVVAPDFNAPLPEEIEDLFYAS